MRAIDADTLLLQLSDDLPYKSSVKRVLMQAPTIDLAKKVFDSITMRFNEAEYEMENFISNCTDTDAISTTRDRLDGLSYAMSIIEEIESEYVEDSINGSTESN